MLCMFLQTINNEEDERAFEELYKKYSKKLLAYAIGKLGRSGNFQDAEDAVRQTFCRIIAALPPPKGDDVNSKEIKNYLYATLAGICLDKLEKKNKEKSVMFLTDEIQNFRQSLDELADSIIDKLTLDKVIEEIEKLHKLEIELETKYDLLLELGNYFDPIYIKLLTEIHKRDVDKIREKNRLKREKKIY